MHSATSWNKRNTYKYIIIYKYVKSATPWTKMLHIMCCFDCVLVLCFVMDCVLHSGEITHKRVHYYYTCRCTPHIHCSDTDTSPYSDLLCHCPALSFSVSLATIYTSPYSDLLCHCPALSLSVSLATIYTSPYSDLLLSLSSSLPLCLTGHYLHIPILWLTLSLSNSLPLCLTGHYLSLNCRIKLRLSLSVSVIDLICHCA